MSNEKKDLIKITGLWSGTDAKGNQFLSGNLNGSARIMIFTNVHKEEENHPDFNMYITENVKKDDG